MSRIYSIVGFAVALISICITSCGQQAPVVDSRAEYWIAERQRVEARDPVAEARVQFEAGDFRFFAVAQDKIVVPLRKTYADPSDFEDRYGVSEFPGTSDALENQEHRTYQDAAYKFCSAYNEEMLRLLNSRSAP